MLRNIPIAYILSFLNRLWFWAAIWVLFYLRFTNYAGIGLLESLMIIITVSSEIPTGAIADLLGKKKTLALCFALCSVGNVIMGSATNTTFLVISVIIMTFGGALFSGTMEAFIYDTLKEKGTESAYEHTISRVSTLQLIAYATGSILGSLLFLVRPAFPFYATAFSYLVAFFLTFLLKEPSIDTETFSLRSFFNQTKQGFTQLFKSQIITKETFMLLSLAIFANIAYQFLNDAMAINFGYRGIFLGTLTTVVALSAAAASLWTTTFSKTFGILKGIIILTCFTTITFIFSPHLGMITGGLSLIFRNIFLSLSSNLTSTVINSNTESKYRATTLSTFNMITSLPYVIMAFFIGKMIDASSSTNVAMYLGLVMIGVIIYQVITFLQISQKEHVR